MLTTNIRQQGVESSTLYNSLSAKKFLRTVFVVCVLYSFRLTYAHKRDPLHSVPNEKKSIKTHINNTKNYFVT